MQVALLSQYVTLRTGEKAANGALCFALDRHKAWEMFASMKDVGKGEGTGGELGAAYSEKQRQGRRRAALLLLCFHFFIKESDIHIEMMQKLVS